jgi:hypothetical protein
LGNIYYPFFAWSIFQPLFHSHTSCLEHLLGSRASAFSRTIMAHDLMSRIIIIHFDSHNAHKNKKVHNIVVKLDLCGTKTLFDASFNYHSRSHIPNLCFPKSSHPLLKIKNKQAKTLNKLYHPI